MLEELVPPYYRLSFYVMALYFGKIFINIHCDELMPFRLALTAKSEYVVPYADSKSVVAQPCWNIYPQAFLGRGETCAVCLTAEENHNMMESRGECENTPI